MSITRARRGHTTADPSYSPFALSTDAGRFGLTETRIPTSLGVVRTRHGRRVGAGGSNEAPMATILLHGAAGSWTTWTPLIQASDLPGAVRLENLVIPDLPGWGDTPLALDESAETIETLAGAVAEIARALGYERWQVIGHSLGGVIALELAAAMPVETRFVGLVSATTFSVIESVRHPIAGFGVLPGFNGLLGTMRMLSASGAWGGRLVAVLHRLGFLRTLVAPLFSRAGDIDGSVVAALAREARPRSFALAADRIRHFDAARSWARVECPVRSVHGDRDVFVRLNDDGKLAGLVADFGVTVLADTGHFAHVERPAQALVSLATASSARTLTASCAFPGSLAQHRKTEES